MHFVRVNNFIKQTSEPCTIDRLSKAFVMLEWVLGLDRISVLCSVVYVQCISFVYSCLLISGIIYLLSQRTLLSGSEYVEAIKLVQYVLCAIMAFAFRKRIRRYYSHLHRFNVEVGSKPKLARVWYLVILLMLAVCAVFMFVFSTSELFVLIPVHLASVVENHFYGFLFTLLNQKLRFINHCLESSLSSESSLSVMKNNAFVTVTKDGKSFQFVMNKLMDFYYIIITAYDSLIDAIKWQLLVITTTSFLYTLGISYHLSIHLIREYKEVPTDHLVFDAFVVSTEILPLIAPCMSCDSVRHEVNKLRELLASKLFESKMDKSNRNVARALLALTKARNLSFSLLRMVDISISLPFSYLGLLATYLIILLQFAKVINPNYNAAPEEI